MSRLPQPGDVFAYEVRAGVELLLRVVAAVGDTRCVVATCFSGPARKTPPKDAALFAAQPLDHHDRERPLIGGWISTPAPKTLRRLGRVPVKRTESARVLHPEAWVKVPRKTAALAQKVVPLTTWDALCDEARAQWRWDHERAAVEREDAARDRDQADTLEAALARNRAEEEALLSKGLPGLRERRFFAVWEGEKSDALIREAEEAMRGAVRELEGLSPARAAQRLVKLVKAFNALDGKHGEPFDASDAEDIMEAVLLLAQVCDVTADDFTRLVDAARTF